MVRVTASGCVQLSIMHAYSGNAGSGFVEISVSNDPPNQSGGHLQVLVPTTTLMKHNDVHPNRVRLLGITSLEVYLLL